MDGTIFSSPRVAVLPTTMSLWLGRGISGARMRSTQLIRCYQKRALMGISSTQATETCSSILRDSGILHVLVYARIMGVLSWDASLFLLRPRGARGNSP